MTPVWGAGLLGISVIGLGATFQTGVDVLRGTVLKSSLIAGLTGLCGLGGYYATGYYATSYYIDERDGD